MEKGGLKHCSLSRLVLGAVSPFMAVVLSSLPPGLPHVTVLLPDVRRELLQQLIDFIYTGVMQVLDNMWSV